MSSRSQGPTLKWSMEVIFRGECVRGDRTRKGKRLDEREKQLDWALRHRGVIGSEKVEKTWE